MGEHGIFPGPVPHLPQLRLYLTTREPVPVTTIFSALRDYDVFPQREAGELFLVRKMRFESEVEFRAECRRVAGQIAPLLFSDCRLSCFYEAQPDIEIPMVQFRLHLVKPSEALDFLEETYPPLAGH